MDGNSNNISSLNFKETELRLGLPGFISPERKSGTVVGVSLFGIDLQNKHKNNVSSVVTPLKNHVAGAKRGFSDVIDGSEVDMGKGTVLFSPRGGNVGKSLVGLDANNITPNQTIKEVGNVIVSQSVMEKNNQVSGTNDHAIAPAAK
ncbi:hypothetical protein TanjilG_30083 [Lupinus angustifolius]|uniref:Uncharacterized protein n=2 Tax=Lupinus angustifolius TaxID=3871 RepID=A0A4P1R745_LUPAN|nr:hypothetical protein TanjilG_30083 [Lupinus angustifolius]